MSDLLILLADCLLGPFFQHEVDTVFTHGLEEGLPVG